MNSGKELLLIIDMQNGFFKHLAMSSNRSIVVGNILKLKAYFKTKNNPIIYTTITHKEDSTTIGIESSGPWNVIGSDDANIIKELIPESEDIVINKHRFSAFFKTSLLGYIKENSISKVYITGLTASMCVMNTSFDCYNNDIESKVIVDAIMDDSDENLKFFQSYFLKKGIALELKDFII